MRHFWKEINPKIAFHQKNVKINGSKNRKAGSWKVSGNKL